MAYPATPLDVEVDLQLGGAWVNAATTGGGVLHDGAVNVSYGRGNWAGTADPARLGFVLRNTDGRWSPDYVQGAHYNLYKRNIPCRAGVGLGETYLTPTGANFDMATTPNVAAINITGDIDIRIDFTLERDLVDIDKGGDTVRLAHKSDGLSGWQWEMYRKGNALHQQFIWWDSGSVFHSVNTEGFTSTLPWSIMSERTGLRVTLDVNAGATWNVTFYTAATIAGPWTAYATDLSGGVTSLGGNGETLRVAGVVFDPGYLVPIPGRTNAFELRSGINGTVVANPNFTTQAVGATSFTDGTGKVWSIGTGGRLTNMRWRFHGELASLPVRWDLSGNLITAPVDATGILRRLRQGDALESALRRHTTRTAPDVIQYWPCEETGSGLTQFGAAVGDAPLIVYAGGTPKLASNTDFPASSALPSIAGTAWATWVDSYTPTGQWQVRWLMSIPDNATGTDVAIMRIYTTDMIWQVTWEGPAGGLKLEAIRGSTVVFTTGYVAFEATGKPLGMHLQVTTSGANVSYQLTGQPVGGTAGGIAGTGVVAGNPGQVWHLIVNQNAADLDAGIGHITLQSTVTDTAELERPVNAWLGEQAGDRIQRLCLEEGIAYRVQGNPFDTEPMGYQLPLSLAELLQECADTDGGLLHEARESFAVGYRTRVSMQSQTALALSYSDGQIAGAPELDRDDQGFANDVTVRSSMGGNGRAVLNDDSALSIAEPPVGAGRYTSSYDANCLENRTTDLAGWRLRLSTPNEPRVSRLTLETNLPNVASNPTLTQSILDLSLGDLIQVTGLPATTYTGTLRQLVQGVRETITMFSHQLDLNTSAASPWDARRIGIDNPRYDTAGSILASAAAVNATSISVATLTGPTWTTAGADMPFDILVGGVRVTVTAIGAVSSGVQTFTISALPIARDLGFDVRLADPTYYEL